MISPLTEEAQKKTPRTSGLELTTTNFFTRQKGPENIANAPAFAETAFKLPMMDLSDITEIGNAYYLIQAIDREPEKIPALAEVKDNVTRDAKKAQQKIAAANAAAQFLEKAKAAGSVLAAAEEDTLITVKSTGHITRKGSVPGIGNDQKFIAQAFELTEAAKIPDQVVDGQARIICYGVERKEKPPGSRDWISPKPAFATGYCPRSKVAIQRMGRKNSATTATLLFPNNF
ncbi:MAG: peptidyl-prolyl cis-trans isomerase [Desulfobacterales bacterium]